MDMKRKFLATSMLVLIGFFGSIYPASGGCETYTALFTSATPIFQYAHYPTPCCDMTIQCETGGSYKRCWEENCFWYPDPIE